MASKNERELLRVKKLLKEVNDLREQFGEGKMSINFDNASAESLKSNFKELTDYAVKYKSALDDANSKAGDLNATIKANLEEMGKIASAQKKYNSSLNRSSNLSQKLADDAMGIAELRGKEVNNLVKQAKLELARRGAIKAELVEKRDLTRDITDEEEKLLRRMEGEYNVQEKLVEKSKERLKEEKKINKAMGLSGAAVKGMTNLLGKIGIDSDHFAGMSEDMRESAKSGSKFKVALTGVAGLAAGIGAALSDPLVVIGLIIKAIKFLISILDHANKVTAKVGESLGIAGKNAKELKHQIHAAGDAGGDMFYFTDEMVDNYMELNKAAGMNLKFNEKNAKMFQDMTHYMGLSVEQASGLFKISAETNVPFSNIYDNIVDTVNELDSATGFSSDMGSIIDGMVNASSSVRYNIKGGAEGLAKAAHTANRLGLSMDEIAAAAETHLDFESSIAKEIEAEMYLQKDLNLDKLRYAALTGDTVTAAAEEERLIKENMKSLKGNVLAQQAFAAATGISRDRLNDVMSNQERISKLTPQQLKDEKDKAATMAEQGKTAQTFDRSMQSAVLQLKAALLPIAEKLGPVLIKGAEFIGNFVGSPAGKTLLAVAGLVATGAIIGKIGSSIMKLFTGGLGKKGTYINPMIVKDIGGGGGGNNLTNMLKGNIFKYLGKKGGLSRTMNRTLIRAFGKNGFTKMMQTKVFNPLGKSSTMVGRGMNNLFGKIIPQSGANLTKTFGTNQMNKIQKMSQTGRNAAGQFIPKALQSKAGNMVSKFTRPGAGVVSNVASKASGLLPKAVTTTLSKAGPLLTKTLKVLGPVGVAADLVMGGASGYSQSQMSAEEQKAAGVEQGISATKATTLGVLTGGAEKGSMFSESLGIEKGSAGDEAMGIAGAAGRGALTGAALGSFIPIIGTGIGAAVGGAIGGISETFKVFSDPDSSLRKWTSNAIDDVGNFAKKAGGKIYDFAAGGLKAYTGFYKKAGTKFLDFASSSAETLGGWASSAGEKISGWASSAGETISGWASSAGETMSGWASSAMDTMSGWASSAGEGISSFFGNVSDGVSSLASGAADLASEAGAYLSDVGSSIANSSVGKAVSSTYDSVMESDYNPINWFAEGGVVTKPMIGGVGEAGPEAIIPLSQAGNMLGGGEVTKLLKELISEVRKGGNVYLDGSKVGYALALQSSKMG